MISLQTIICTRHEDIPQMECRNFFHSRELFRMFEQTPRMKPFMAVALAPEGTVAAHLLAVVRYRATAIPPFLYTHCMVMGEGEYADSRYTREELFGNMLRALTKKVQGKVLYIEFSQISEKMFGYRIFRRMGYFPVLWQSIRNSLHSKPPEERLVAKAKRRIAHAMAKGVSFETVDSEEGLKAFAALLKRHNRLKPKRYIPDIGFFRQMMGSDSGKLFLTKYKEKVVGCCLCAFSGNDAYLWYTASLRKTYAMVHPATATVWNILDYAHRHHYDHVSFMDVGLPLHKNHYRDFILQFGGKPVSTYRWFRCSIGWINKALAWIYRE